MIQIVKEMMALIMITKKTKITHYDYVANKTLFQQREKKEIMLKEGTFEI